MALEKQKVPFIDNRGITNRQFFLMMGLGMLAIIGFGYGLSKTVEYDAIVGLHDLPLIGPRLAAYDRVAPNDAYYYLASLPVCVALVVVFSLILWSRYDPNGTYTPPQTWQFRNPYVRIITIFLSIGALCFVLFLCRMGTDGWIRLGQSGSFGFSNAGVGIFCCWLSVVARWGLFETITNAAKPTNG